MIFLLSTVLSDLLYISMCNTLINYLIAFWILYNFYSYFLFDQIFIEEIFSRFLFVEKNSLFLDLLHYSHIIHYHLNHFIFIIVFYDNIRTLHMCVGDMKIFLMFLVDILYIIRISYNCIIFILCRFFTWTRRHELCFCLFLFFL